VVCQCVSFIRSATTAQQLVSTGLKEQPVLAIGLKKKLRAEAEHDCLDRYVTMVTDSTTEPNLQKAKNTLQNKFLYYSAFVG